jgi:DNA-binding NtrC family response regulator
MEKILLVDGETHDQCRKTAFLAAHGYHILKAADDRAARQALEQAPDIVVGHRRLPGSEVVELLPLVRQTSPHTPVIVLTPPDAAGSGVELLSQGAFGYLTTPVNLAEMLIVIQRAAERLHLQREVQRLQQLQRTEENNTTPQYRPGTRLEELEREVIQYCLLENAGNRQRTADVLGISTRTLLRKIHDYRLQDPLRWSKVNGTFRATTTARVFA